MRLGIGSYTYGWGVDGVPFGGNEIRRRGALTAADIIGRAKALGVRVVQLCDNLPAETWEPASIERLAGQADGAGISVQVGTRGSDPDHLSRFARIAGRFGSPVLRLVIDAPGDRPEVPEIVRRFREALPTFEACGVTLAVENHDRFPTEALVEIVRAAASPRVGVCLDTVNSLGAAEGPRAVVAALGPLTVNLHLKDFTVTRVSYLQGFAVEGRPLGIGMLDVPWLLGKLAEFGRDPDAIVELWTPPLPTIEATIVREAEWAEASVLVARRWIND